MILDALSEIAAGADQGSANIAITALQKEASRIAGREVEVDQTDDGKFIVLWMHFQAPPPPKANTKGEALAGFINMMLRRKDVDASLPEADTKENTDGTDTGSPAVDN